MRFRNLLFIDVYGVFAKNQKVILRNNIFRNFPKNSLKWPPCVLSRKTNGFWGAETPISALLQLSRTFAPQNAPSAFWHTCTKDLGGRRGEKVRKVHFWHIIAISRTSGSREGVKTTVFITTFDMGAKSENIFGPRSTFAKSAISALSGAEISGPRPLLFAFGRFG